VKILMKKGEAVFFMVFGMKFGKVIRVFLGNLPSNGSSVGEKSKGRGGCLRWRAVHGNQVCWHGRENQKDSPGGDVVGGAYFGEDMRMAAGVRPEEDSCARVGVSGCGADSDGECMARMENN
jgi:hypothetical protein